MKKASLAHAVVLLLLAAAAAGEERFEKTIAFPRSGDAPLGWTYRNCTIRSVQVRNYPDAEDIAKARAKDPGDHSWLWWEFRVDNRGSRDCKVRVWVEVLDKNGKLVKDGDHSGNVDAGQIDDAIRVSTRLRTLDAADSPKVRLRAEIIPK